MSPTRDLVPRDGAERLDAAHETGFGEGAQDVVHRLVRDLPELAADVGDDRLGVGVRATAQGLEDGDPRAGHAQVDPPQQGDDLGLGGHVITLPPDLERVKSRRVSNRSGPPVDVRRGGSGARTRVTRMTSTLVLLRHGESDWNAKNLFTGWVDVDLSDKGRNEAVAGGRMLAEAGLLPDVVHTSVLRRAITTANLALDAADRHWIPVRRDWRLNERHYGDLQGKDKKQTLEEFGEEQFMLWRRSYDTPPPPIADDNEYSQQGDPRYADLGDLMPRTECLKDVVARLVPYWENEIRTDLRAGKTVLVAAHGNSLRALVKHLDGIGDDEIAALNIPTGMPLVYELDEDFAPVAAGGRYLDPEAAAAAAAAVANQGR